MGGSVCNAKWSQLFLTRRGLKWLIHSNVAGLFFQVLIAEEAEAEAGVGELCISSPAMFKEYWRKPEVSKSFHLSIWNG